jgi:hypothetical protein
MISSKLASMKADPRFSDLLAKGRQANVRYSSGWSNRGGPNTSSRGRSGSVDGAALKGIVASTAATYFATAGYNHFVDIGSEIGTRKAFEAGFGERLRIAGGLGELGQSLSFTVDRHDITYHVVIEPVDNIYYFRVFHYEWNNHWFWPNVLNIVEDIPLGKVPADYLGEPPFPGPKK